MNAEVSEPYKMSFSTGGLFINESLELAKLHKPGEEWIDTVVRAVDEGASSLPKSTSQRRNLREISHRVSQLTDEERELFIEDADRAECQSLLWLATCRAYRFVREFATEVLRERYLSYQLDLPLETFDVFFAAKAEWDEDLESISDSTRLKLRQILFRMMREAGVLSDDDKIQTVVLSKRLHSLIAERNRRDLLVFPGVQAEGA